MTGFEPRTSDVGRDHSTNCATPPPQTFYFYLRPSIESHDEPTFPGQDRQVDPPPHDVNEDGYVVRLLALVRQKLDQLALQGQRRHHQVGCDGL